MYDRELVLEILSAIIIFDVNADAIYKVCQDHIGNLAETIKKIINDI